jgi:hypothetical protein
MNLIEIIPIIVVVLGITGNIISMIICLKKELRKTPTFIFKIFINIMNIIPLITIIIYSFTTDVYEIKFNEFYFNFFKTLLFLILWTWQSSAYLQVYILIIINIINLLIFKFSI